jgi:hypothetical protein
MYHLSSPISFKVHVPTPAGSLSAVSGQKFIYLQFGLKPCSFKPRDFGS